MKKLIECVPNFSEGRDPAVIEALAAVIREADGVNLLDVDPGAATNRTVVTYVGEPEKVLDAAVAVAKKSAELIDMSKHSGEHPRFGAMDVCPLVPVSGVSMEETVGYARELGRRLGEEVGLTIYCYEHAATRPERKNLAIVRAGEYEALPEIARPRMGTGFRAH
jgi:glutamate formiminotransferase/formiminotetrahydrofolate cyclodeaminase